MSETQSEGGAAGNVQEVANQLVDATRNAASTGADLVQGVGNAGVDAIRGEAATLLGAVGESLEHLANLFNNLSKALIGE